MYSTNNHYIMLNIFNIEKNFDIASIKNKRGEV